MEAADQELLEAEADQAEVEVEEIQEDLEAEIREALVVVQEDL